MTALRSPFNHISHSTFWEHVEFNILSGLTKTFMYKYGFYHMTRTAPLALSLQKY